MLYVCLIWAAAFVLSFFEKKASTRTGEMASTFAFVGVRNVIGVAIALTVAFIIGENFSLTSTLMLCAVTFGVLVVIDVVNLMYLAKSGMMALVMVCGYAGSIIVPAVFEMATGESVVAPLQWLFVATLLLASYMLCNTSKGMYNFNF